MLVKNFRARKIKHLFDGRCDQQGARRRLHFVLDAHEHRVIKGLAHFCQRVTDVRLAHAESLTGFRDAARFKDGLKYDQHVKVLFVQLHQGGRSHAFLRLDRM